MLRCGSKVESATVAPVIITQLIASKSTANGDMIFFKSHLDLILGERTKKKAPTGRLYLSQSFREVCVVCSMDGVFSYTLMAWLILEY
jgi:hypothetical protein